MPCELVRQENAERILRDCGLLVHFQSWAFGKVYVFVIPVVFFMHYHYTFTPGSSSLPLGLSQSTSSLRLPLLSINR